MSSKQTKQTACKLQPLRMRALQHAGAAAAIAALDHCTRRFSGPVLVLQLLAVLQPMPAVLQGVDRSCLHKQRLTVTRLRALRNLQGAEVAATWVQGWWLYKITHTCTTAAAG